MLAAPPAQAAAWCQRLAYRFGRVDALRHVDLTVGPGEVYGLLGLNGAGKTTTIRLLLGLLRPRSGSVQLLGLPTRPRCREAFRRVGVLFETFSAHGFLTGEEHLRTRATLLGFPRRESRRLAAEWLDRTGLREAARKRTRDYSHGMLRRLGVACALVGSPRLAVLDEPTNGLDPQGIADLRELVLAMNREAGTTFLISSHILGEVEQLCGRIGILHEGRTLLEGCVADLLGRSSGLRRLRVAPLSLAKRLISEEGWCDLVGSEESAEHPPLMRVRVAASELPRLVRLLVQGGVDVHEVANEAESLESLFHRTVASGGSTELVGPGTATGTPREARGAGAERECRAPSRPGKEARPE